MPSTPSQPSRKKEYAFFLSFSVFTGTFFFLGIYIPLQRTLWLSLLAGGIAAALFLTLLLRLRASLQGHPLLGRLLALISLAYGGISLYAFFVFCSHCIFPGHSFFFFPVCFLLLTAYGAEKGLYALERTSKFTSVAVAVLLVLTIASTLQKMWDQREFIGKTAALLLDIEASSFAVQTMLITVVLLWQALILFHAADDGCRAPQLLSSIRRALLPSILFSSALHLCAAAALGAYSFEFLTYPVYDMLSLPGYAEYLDRTEFLMLIAFLFCESCKTVVMLRAGRKLFFRQEATDELGCLFAQRSEHEVQS